MSQQKNYPHNITGGLSRRSFLQSGLILGGSLVLPLNLLKLLAQIWWKSMTGYGFHLTAPLF